ncbi:MAG: hypothetical protein NT157_06575 [Candidatus Micrarchaeota archaeon]|nr:hypothetical protein [Candidatus Micrarchaeota archaeon]
MLVVKKAGDVRKCDETEVLIKTKPTTRLLAEILNNTKVETILLTRGMHGLIPFNAVVALRKVGVRVKIVEGKRGRPAKYGEGEIRRLHSLYAKGVGIKEIAMKTKTPLRTVYHHLRKANKSRRAKD